MSAGMKQYPTRYDLIGSDLQVRKEMDSNDKTGLQNYEWHRGLQNQRWPKTDYSLLVPF